MTDQIDDLFDRLQKQMDEYQDALLVEFFKHVKVKGRSFRGTSCLQWTGPLVHGYGWFEGTTAHRWAYEHFRDPVPDDLDVDHDCHNADLTCPGGECAHRACVNPFHCSPATRGDNIRHGWERIRQSQQVRIGEMLDVGQRTS